MNVSCPSCETVYRVDPAKVPAGGVRARCAVCSNVFTVAASAVAPQPVGAGVATGGGAPVFTPTTTTPRTPPVPPPPPPMAPAAAPPAPAPMAPAGGGAPLQRKTGPLRAVNPFLVQDPKQKARRLARALISDMIVYHPEKRQNGMRDGTLPQLFKDEIEKSWLEYVEQVGAEMAQSTPFCSEALNEILAGGHKLL